MSFSTYILRAKVPRFVIGHKHVQASPRVVRTGKWGVNFTAYPFNCYPPYLVGPSYVMTTDLASRMISVAQKIPLVPNEDAHITGILARVLRVPRLHFDAFAHDDKKCLPCNIVYNEEVSMTNMSLSRIMLLWRDILRGDCSSAELLLVGNSILSPSVKGQDVTYKRIDTNSDVGNNLEIKT